MRTNGTNSEIRYGKVAHAQVRLVVGREARAEAAVRGALDQAKQTDLELQDGGPADLARLRAARVLLAQKRAISTSCVACGSSAAGAGSASVRSRAIDLAGDRRRGRPALASSAAVSSAPENRVGTACASWQELVEADRAVPVDVDLDDHLVELARAQPDLARRRRPSPRR